MTDEPTIEQAAETLRDLFNGRSTESDWDTQSERRRFFKALSRLAAAAREGGEAKAHQDRLREVRDGWRDGFMDAARERERPMSEARNGDAIAAENAVARLEAEVKRWQDAFGDAMDDVRSLTAERDRLTNIIRDYVIATGRAPNNRDEAEIDAAATALVHAVALSPQEGTTDG